MNGMTWPSYPLSPLTSVLRQLRMNWVKETTISPVFHYHNSHPGSKSLWKKYLLISSTENIYIIPFHPRRWESKYLLPVLVLSHTLKYSTAQHSKKYKSPLLIPYQAQHSIAQQEKTNLSFPTPIEHSSGYQLLRPPNRPLTHSSQKEKENIISSLRSS